MTTIERTRSTDEGSYTAMAYVMKLDGQEIGWASLSVSENAYCERIASACGCSVQDLIRK